MFIADQPNVPPSMSPLIMMTQASSSQQTATKGDHILGVCGIVNPSGIGQLDAFPVINANAYFYTHDAKIDDGTAKVTIIQRPKHGRLEPTNSDGDWSDTRYLPNDGYLGKDSFVLQVEGSGYKVKLYYFLTVTDLVGDTALQNKACKGITWKISSSSPQSTFDLTSLQRSVTLSELLADASQALSGYSDLSEGAVGRS